MVSNNNSKYRWGVLIIAFVSILIKLYFINLNQGEYTDGVIQLTLWKSPVVFFPPGYSVLVWLVDLVMNNLLLSGRIVSITASALTIISLFCLARLILKDDRSAFWAAFMLALSPVFCQWSMRVMTDSVFCLFFVLCTHQFFLCLENPNRPAYSFLGWIGLASLLRYQGFFFLPFFFYTIGKKKDNSSQTGIFTILGWILSLVPWFLLAFWIRYRGFGHQEQFLERASQGWLNTLIAYGVMFETYILYWPWAVTYLLFIIGFIGGFLLWRGEQTGKRFLIYSLGAALVFLIVQSAFRSFQYRYLLPLLPLWCILAARGLSFLESKIPNKNLYSTIKFLLVMNLSLMMVSVLYFQRGTFGDLVESARYLREIGRGSRLLSDEAYREGVYNPKMKFWSGRDMEYYPITEPKSGDLVVLHNAYSDFEVEQKRLSEKFKISMINQWKSSTVPLLPDIMIMSIAPNQIPLTSNPECMAFRFFPQTYSTVLLRLEAKK